MITIKMHNGKWRIIIGDEIWEFEDMIEMDKILNMLITFKDEYGRIEDV